MSIDKTLATQPSALDSRTKSRFWRRCLVSPPSNSAHLSKRSFEHRHAVEVASARPLTSRSRRGRARHGVIASFTHPHQTISRPRRSRTPSEGTHDSPFFGANATPFGTRGEVDGGRLPVRPALTGWVERRPKELRCGRQRPGRGGPLRASPTLCLVPHARARAVKPRRWPNSNRWRITDPNLQGSSDRWQRSGPSRVVLSDFQSGYRRLPDLTPHIGRRIGGWRRGQHLTDRAIVGGMMVRERDPCRRPQSRRRSGSAIGSRGTVDGCPVGRRALLSPRWEGALPPCWDSRSWRA